MSSLERDLERRMFPRFVTVTCVPIHSSENCFRFNVLLRNILITFSDLVGQNFVSKERVIYSSRLVIISNGPKLNSTMFYGNFISKSTK